MHSLLLISALAGSTLAFVGHHSFTNSTIPSPHPSTHTLLPTGGEGGDKPSHTHGNGTSSPQPTTTVVPSSLSTITETITKTTFKPCSTPIHSQSGTTYYSTWLATSTYETTTCFTTHVPPATTPGSPSVTTAVSLPGSCPPPSTFTVTVTVTGGNAATHTQAPEPNTYGYTTTIVIPPISQPTSTATTHTTGTGTRTGTTTKPTPPLGTGTGSVPSHSHTRGSPNGTGDWQAPTETKTWHFERRMVRV